MIGRITTKKKALKWKCMGCNPMVLDGYITDCKKRIYQHARHGYVPGVHDAIEYYVQ